MNNPIIKLLKNTASRLIFALASGAAYYLIALRFILSHTNNGGGLLGFFFLPAIVCGMGLIIIKILRSMEENQNARGMIIVFWTHVLLIVISIVSAIALI